MGMSNARVAINICAGMENMKWEVNVIVRMGKLVMMGNVYVLIRIEKNVSMRI